MSVQDELQAIYERDGVISPSAVVEAAKPKDSPLHPYFTWNQSAAAEQWRLHEARQLIKRVKVTVVRAPETTVRTRVFVNLPDRGYMPTVDVLSDPVRRRDLFAQCVGEIAALRRKYKDLIDFDAALSAAVDQERDTDSPDAASA